MIIEDERKVAVIVGGTGNQGGVVVEAFLKKKNDWNIVVITRNCKSNKSKTLMEKGVQIIEADLNDKITLDKALSQAGKEINGVFCVTNYWAKGVKEKEIDQAKNLIQAVEDHKNVNIFVYASCGSADPKERPGHLSLVDFNTRWKVEQHLKKKLNIRSVVLRPPQFSENFFGWMEETHIASKTHFGWPGVKVKSDVKHAWICGSDYGDLVENIIRNPKEYVGKTLNPASFVLTFREMLSLYESALNLPKGSVKVGSKVNIWILYFFFTSGYRVLNFFNRLDFTGVDIDLSYMPKVTSWEEFLKSKSNLVV